ncbi:MAG TPA: MFS transporter, partial [Gemmata sp.]
MSAVSELPTASPARNRFRVPALAAVGVAAAAMVATLPGRTQGLGLITEPLRAELALEKVPFAAINFWATLIGAAFCVPVGWAMDRFGTRVVLAAVLLTLGAVVLAMTAVHPGAAGVELLTPEFLSGRLERSRVPLDLFVLVLLTRGLGQSALSVVSLALIGKVAGQKPGPAVGAYSLLVAVGFMGAFGGIMAAFKAGADWHAVWAGIGWALVAGGVLAVLFVREPRAVGAPGADRPATARERSHTLPAALRAPAFWVFGLATSFYGLVAAGTSLFNQSLLEERGFDRDVFLTITTLAPVIGLGANLVTGWLALRVRLGGVLAGSMLLQAGALGYFPYVSSLGQVYAYAVAMGVSGGMLT